MRLRCISAGRFADAANNGNLVFVEVGEMWERVPYISISGSPYARLNREGRSILLCESLLGEFFKEVAERRTGIPAKNIQKCCTGRMKSTRGAVFAYLGAKVVG